MHPECLSLRSSALFRSGTSQPSCSSIPHIPCRLQKASCPLSSVRAVRGILPLQSGLQSYRHIPALFYRCQENPDSLLPAHLPLRFWLRHSLSKHFCVPLFLYLLTCVLVTEHRGYQPLGTRHFLIVNPEGAKSLFPDSKQF